jgi:glycerol-3-phosphate dehydrogenase
MIRMTISTPTTKQGSFSFVTRQHNLERLATETFDYIIVGGGITGAGIARDAAMRGRRVALIEKSDFAFGTSSRSSKLVHGGVRYLETFEFGLVFEASTERRRLRHMAPYLVKPLPFLLPIYKGAKNGFYKIMAGMWLYDILSLFRNIKRHKMLRPKEVLGIFPPLRADGLTGAPRYYDCGVDDARLTLLTLLSAHDHGALIANYTQVTGLVKIAGKTKGVVVRDVLTGQEITVHGEVVISALGPWTDAILKMDDPKAQSLMRPTKGVHVLVKRARLGSDHALGYFSPRDGRLMFLIPWDEFSIIGTTDTDYRGDLDNVYADDKDIDYILDAINVQFPSVHLTKADIISTYAGVRPLVSEGAEKGTESSVSREHKIWETPSGLLCIAGGKLTTYRSMGKQLVDVAEKKLTKLTGAAVVADPHSDREALMAGGVAGMQEDLSASAHASLGARLPTDVIEHLLHAYGSGYPHVTAILDENPHLSERIVADLPYIKAEAVHAVRNEMAMTLIDVMSRRLHLLMEDRNQGLDVVATLAELVGEELGWSADEQQRQVAAYRAEVARTRASLA